MTRRRWIREAPIVCIIEGILYIQEYPNSIKSHRDPPMAVQIGCADWDSDSRAKSSRNRLHMKVIGSIRNSMYRNMMRNALKHAQQEVNQTKPNQTKSVTKLKVAPLDDNPIQWLKWWASKSLKKIAWTCLITHTADAHKWCQTSEQTSEHKMHNRIIKYQARILICYTRHQAHSCITMYMLAASPHSHKHKLHPHKYSHKSACNAHEYTHKPSLVTLQYNCSYGPILD